MATLEKTVLVVDADPQANASSGLGVDIKRGRLLCSTSCIIDHADVRDAIYTTDIDGLDIIPSHIDLVGAEIEMLNLKNREKVIKTLLQPIRDEYDLYPDRLFAFAGPHHRQLADSSRQRHHPCSM